MEVFVSWLNLSFEVVNKWACRILSQEFFKKMLVVL